MTELTAAVRQFALQKIRIPPLSTFQSPLRPKSPNPLRDILSHFLRCFFLFLLPPCLFFFFPIHLMSQSCFLFMTVEDWGAMLQCQLSSRGERSGTWANKNCHLLRGVQLTLGDKCECLSVCSHAAFSLGVDILSQQHRGEKQANMLVQRFATGQKEYWGLLIYSQWQDHGASCFTVQQAIAVQLWEIWKCSIW